MSIVACIHVVSRATASMVATVGLLSGSMVSFILLLFLLSLYSIGHPLGTQVITDLYATLPEDVTVIPQEYTVHCLNDIECPCIQANSPVEHHMFMEGSLSQPALEFCNTTTSLSCSQGTNTNVTSITDNQFIVTWNADEVITQGGYDVMDNPGNGDHDFLCVAVYTSSGDEGQVMENPAMSVRGNCLQNCYKFHCALIY